MPDITDAAVIAHTDEVARPLSNVLTGLIPYLRVELVRWDDQIQPLANAGGTTGASLLMDGSGPDGDGRIQLNRNDLDKFWDQVRLIVELADGTSPVQTALGELAFEDLIKPHVKPKFPV